VTSCSFDHWYQLHGGTHHLHTPPLKWRQHIPSKRRQLSGKLYDARTQNLTMYLCANFKSQTIPSISRRGNFYIITYRSLNKHDTEKLYLLSESRRHVVRLFIEVSEKSTAPIFRVEEYVNQLTSKTYGSIREILTHVSLFSTSAAQWACSYTQPSFRRLIAGVWPQRPGLIPRTLNVGNAWLRHYAASRKVAGSSPDEVDFLKNFT
jgi:hypothetical protein